MDTIEYRIVYNGPIYNPMVNNLRHRIAAAIERSDFGALTILFSSEGGSTDQGLSLHNFLRTLPVPVHMHAMGHIGSIAVPVFLAGHRRTCEPICRFFFHAYDWGFEGRQMSDRIAEAQQRLDSDSELSRKIVETRSKIPHDKLDTLYGRAPTPTIILPEEAKALALVDDILDLETSGPDRRIAVWTVAG